MSGVAVAPAPTPDMSSATDGASGSASALQDSNPSAPPSELSAPPPVQPSVPDASSGGEGGFMNSGFWAGVVPGLVVAVVVITAASVWYCRRRRTRPACLGLQVNFLRSRMSSMHAPRFCCIVVGPGSVGLSHAVSTRCMGRNV